ncbi:hypothetical protein MASR2M79_17160 [Aminivibrio sp.]
MRRWFPAIAASLVFHLLLLLIPASLPEASETPPVLRLVLRNIETPVRERSEKSERTAPAASQPSPPPMGNAKEAVMSEVLENIRYTRADSRTPCSREQENHLARDSQKTSRAEVPKSGLSLFKRKLPLQWLRQRLENQFPNKKLLPQPPRKVQKEHGPVQKAGKKNLPPPKRRPVPEKVQAAPPLSARPLWGFAPSRLQLPGAAKKEKFQTLLLQERRQNPWTETLSIVKRVVPVYPLFSRKRGEEGKAVILVTLQSGRVTDAEVERSSGSTRLDAAALRAATMGLQR